MMKKSRKQLFSDFIRFATAKRQRTDDVQVQTVPHPFVQNQQCLFIGDCKTLDNFSTFFERAAVNFDRIKNFTHYTVQFANAKRFFIGFYDGNIETLCGRLHESVFEESQMNETIKQIFEMFMDIYDIPIHYYLPAELREAIKINPNIAETHYNFRPLDI